MKAAGEGAFGQPGALAAKLAICAAKLIELCKLGIGREVRCRVGCRKEAPASEDGVH